MAAAVIYRDQPWPQRGMFGSPLGAIAMIHFSLDTLRRRPLDLRFDRGADRTSRTRGLIGAAAEAGCSYCARRDHATAPWRLAARSESHSSTSASIQAIRRSLTGIGLGNSPALHFR